MIDINGLTVSDIQKMIHDEQGIVMSQNDIRLRLYKFKTLEEVIKTPPHQRKMYKYHGRVVSRAEIVRLSGMSDTAVMNRLNKGMSVEEVIETPKRKYSKEHLPVTLPLDLSEKARTYAKTRGMSLSSLFESLLNDLLSGKGKEDETGKQ